MIIDPADIDRIRLLFVILGQRPYSAGGKELCFIQQTRQQIFF